VPDELPISHDAFIEACARSVLVAHGPDSSRFVTRRVNHLAERLDLHAVKTWQEVLRKLRDL